MDSALSPLTKITRAALVGAHPIPPFLLQDEEGALVPAYCRDPAGEPGLHSTPTAVRVGKSPGVSHPRQTFLKSL